MSNIKPCSCQHEYQDKIYGKGQRAHNQSTKGHRCTACGNEKISKSTK